MTTPIFAKLSAELHRHPKARRAGYHGTNVFRLVLELNALQGATGRLTAAVSEPYYLADALMCSEKEAAKGLAAAVQAKLLEVGADGSIAIVGWDDDEWGRGARKPPLTGAERQARYRANLKIAASGDTVTSSDEEFVTRDVTGDDQLRGDARVRVQRLEEDQSSPSPRARDPIGWAVPLLEHTVSRLDAARAKIDPSARPIGAWVNLGDADRKKLLDKLRGLDESERKPTLDHCLDVLIRLAEVETNVGFLRVGMLAGDASWPRWCTSTPAAIAAEASKPRAPPRPSPVHRYTAADELAALGRNPDAFKPGA
jgi:hypothetical protein